MNKLSKYFLISLIIGLALFVLFVIVNQKVLIETPPTGEEVYPTKSRVNLVPLPANQLRDYISFLGMIIFPIFLFIFSLIYSIKEKKKGFVVSVLGSLLISVLYFLFFVILLGVYNSIFKLYVGEEGLVFLFTLMIGGGLIAASFIVNSVVYFFRIRK